MNKKLMNNNCGKNIIIGFTNALKNEIWIVIALTMLKSLL